MALKDLFNNEAKLDAAIARQVTLAEEALAAGQELYAPTLNTTAGIADHIDVWGMALTAIESAGLSAGWSLEHWAIDAAGNARPVFRRVS